MVTNVAMKRYIDMNLHFGVGTSMNTACMAGSTNFARPLQAGLERALNTSLMLLRNDTLV